MSTDNATPPEILAAAKVMQKDRAPELTAEHLQELSTLEVEVRADFAPLLAQINQDLGLALTPRPEGYHLTIIGPTDKDVLKNLNVSQLDELQRISTSFQRGEGITPTGVGIIDKNRVSNLRKADQDKVTCFLAFDVPALNSFRASVGLPSKDFHITLGFIGGDIHFTVIGEREDEKKKGKMVEVTEPISKKADPAFAKYELPSMTFGGLSGKEKQKAQEKPTKDVTTSAEKKATLIPARSFGGVNKFLRELGIPNAGEVFAILKILEPGQDVRSVLIGKVEVGTVNQIVAKMQELIEG